MAKWHKKNLTNFMNLYIVEFQRDDNILCCCERRSLLSSAIWPICMFFGHEYNDNHNNKMNVYTIFFCMNTCYNAIACTWITVTRVYSVNGWCEYIRYNIGIQLNTIDIYSLHARRHSYTYTHSHRELLFMIRFWTGDFRTACIQYTSHTV